MRLLTSASCGVSARNALAAGGGAVENRFLDLRALLVGYALHLRGLCDLCGCGLAGTVAGDERLILRRVGHVIAGPCGTGGARAISHFAGVGRTLVLGLEAWRPGRDRGAAGPWIGAGGRGALGDDPADLPVPLHWRRLAARLFQPGGPSGQGAWQGRAAGLVPHALLQRAADPHAGRPWTAKSGSATSCRDRRQPRAGAVAG